MTISKWKINIRSKKKILQIFTHVYNIFYNNEKKIQPIFRGNMCHWRNFCLDIELFPQLFFSLTPKFYRYWSENMFRKKKPYESNWTNNVITIKKTPRYTILLICFFTNEIYYYMLNKSKLVEQNIRIQNAKTQISYKQLEN